MSFNLTTDDVWDETQRYSNNKTKKPKQLYKVYDSNGKCLFKDYPCNLGKQVQKHFGLTARWSKKGRWRQILKDNNYTIIKYDPIEKIKKKTYKLFDSMFNCIFRYRN